MKKCSKAPKREPQRGEPVSELPPDRASMSAVREIASKCQACDLYHPSSILRSPDDDTGREEMRRFVEDLRTVAKAIK